MAFAVLVVVVFAATAVVVADHRASSLSQESGGATLVTYTTAHQATVGPLNLARLGSSQRFTLTSSLGRRPLVINFFASWCTACQAELRAVALVANAEAGRVPFFGVDTNETSDSQAIRMLSNVRARYPVGIGTTTQANEFLVPGLPTTLFVDARGKVVAMAYGQLSRAELSRWVGELAAGKPLTPVT
jgi:cytochrome c biogenesis protein CcmG/thiol:disulfide interchange protein DsbE